MNDTASHADTGPVADSDPVADSGPVADSASVAETATDADVVVAPGDPVRSSAWLAWTVAVALALLAAFAFVQWRSVAVPAAAEDAAGVAAAAYVQRLANWDATAGLDETYNALIAGASETFAPQVDEVFGPGTRRDLVTIDAVSTGTVDEVLTGRLLEAEAGDTVQVVVFAEQLIVSGPTADPVARTDRVASLRMLRQDGVWFVDDLEMLSELERDPSTGGDR